MTAHLTIVNKILVIEVEGIHKILAFKSKLEIPIKHITRIYSDSEIVNTWCCGIRFPGINIPRVITAGTFYKHGDKVFWDVCNPKKTIIVELKDEDYAKLVIEVNDPKQTMEILAKELPDIANV